MCQTITVFDREISTYSLMAFAGAAAIIVFCVLQCRFPRRNAFVKPLAQDMFYMLLLAAIGTFVGARLMFVITSANFAWNGEISFLDNVWGWILQVAMGGLVFYGGLIGAAAVAMIYILHYKTPVSEMLDLTFAGVPLFHALGRIGCFTVGCCYGIEYHGPFAAVFPERSIGGAPANVELFPVQLLEAALNLLLWAVLTVIYRKTSRRWLISGLYLVSYGIIRFILEYFRGDLVRGHIYSLSSSQFISVFVIAAGVLLLIRPNWLDRFGAKNDGKYLEWVEEHRRRVEEYRESKRRVKNKK